MNKLFNSAGISSLLNLIGRCEGIVSALYNGTGRGCDRIKLASVNHTGIKLDTVKDKVEDHTRLNILEVSCLHNNLAIYGKNIHIRAIVPFLKYSTYSLKLSAGCHYRHNAVSILCGSIVIALVKVILRDGKEAVSGVHTSERLVGSGACVNGVEPEERLIIYKLVAKLCMVGVKECAVIVAEQLNLLINCIRNLFGIPNDVKTAVSILCKNVNTERGKEAVVCLRAEDRNNTDLVSKVDFFRRTKGARSP